MVRISKQGSLSVGDFLMTAGPCYLQCTDKGRIAIGNNCFMNHNVSITAKENIVIGNEVNIANNVVIVDHDHVMTRNGVLGETISAPVSIGDRVWIGSNAVLTKGIHIGDGAVVAAGAVVCSNIPSHEVGGGGVKKNKIFERIKLLKNNSKGEVDGKTRIFNYCA